MPSSETEHYIKEAGRVRNQANSRGRLLQPARRYLRYNEKAKRQDEAKRLKDMLSPQNIMVSKMGEQSVAMARKHLNSIEEDLEENSAPTNLPGETKDALYKTLNEEIEIYRQGMVPHEEMRRNPVGAVDRHLKHERANKDRALKIKNLLIMLNPDSDEQDLCNLEKYRPHINLPQGASSYMAEAQIPGVFGMTALAKENWPENMPEFGTANSVLKQADERERLEARIKELEAELEAKKPKRGGRAVYWTPERKAAAAEKMRAMAVHRKAKKEELRQQLKEQREQGE